MNEELGLVLKEIAALLRQQVEQADRAQAMSEEEHRLAREERAKMREAFLQTVAVDGKDAETPQTAPAGFASLVQSRKRVEELDAKVEHDRQQRQEFQTRLLAEIERHNAVLERILERLTR